MIKFTIESNNTLAEGPLWHPREQSLYWTDIKEKKILRWNQVTSTIEAWLMPGRVGTFAFVKDGSMLLACEHSLLLGRWCEHGSFKTVAQVPAELQYPHNRLNDGKCSPEGRFWVGTMNTLDPEKNPTGNLFRFTPPQTFEVTATRLGISNGLAWSPNSSRMYHIDSAKDKVYSYAYDGDTGTIGSSKEFINFEEENGTPDGMTIDSEGMLWIAHWGGACVSQWSPEGKKIKQIELPALQITSLSFGDAEMDTLYVTTANDKMTEEQRKQYPESGNIIALDVGAVGLPCTLLSCS